MDDSRLIASVPGIVERVNKLVSVRPMRARCVHACAHAGCAALGAAC